MFDTRACTTPGVLDAIGRDGEVLGFDMSLEPKTGALLMALAATKPAGRFLELGTGIGAGTAWLLAGMSATACLDTVDHDTRVVDIARAHLGRDPRATFHIGDAGEFVSALQPATYDFVFADAWPGKFSHLDFALAALRVGGIYFVDDLLPQANWPDGHGEKVERLIAALDHQEGFISVKCAWASGLMMLVRQHDERHDGMQHDTP